MENHLTIGEKILMLRKARGVTQADLGVYLNISYQAVSKWERDESCPDFETLCRVAQFFNVPITFFERGGETATTVVSPVANTETPVMIGVCKDCGKVVYEGEEQENCSPIVCKSCYERRVRLEKQRAENAKKEAERKQREKEEKEWARVARIRYTRNRALIWGVVIAGFLFLWSTVSSIKERDYLGILGALVIGVFVFTYVAQLFWDGAVVDCTLAGGHIIGTPGIIFTMDLDGVIFLIAMKLLFAVLRLFVWLFTVIVCAVAAVLISPFTFLPALRRINAGG